MPIRLWFLARLATALLLWAEFSSLGAGRYCVVDGWGEGEGLLPQSSVISMVQTRDGYLWLGTLNGLARFDGIHFTLFDESTTPKLSSIQTVKLFEDSRSNLWIGTESGGTMLVTNGQIVALNFGQSGRRGRLVSICEDSLGAIWMLTEGRDLARYLNGSIDVWRMEGADYSVGKSVIAEKSGLVWVATDHALLGLDPAVVKSRSPLPQAVGAVSGQFDFLLTASAGGSWRIANGRITRWQGDKTVQDFGPYPWPATPRVTACEDKEGNLIVGTYGQGIYWFDAGGQFVHISTTNGLANDSILSLTVDSDDSLWVGMDGGGKADRPLNRVARSVFNLLDSTSGQVVQSISETKSGELWFSAKDRDIRVLKNGVTTPVSSIFGSMSRFNPWAVMVDSNQTVWSATRGLSVFRLDDNQFRPADTNRNINPEITALFQSRDGRIWLGTQGGLAVQEGDHWRNFTTNDGLSANIVTALAETADGDMWVGTEHGGLDLLRGTNIIVFRKENGFPSDNISCLYADAAGVLWVGTIGNGLVRVQNGTWKHFTTQDGLTGNSIDYFAEDAEGFLWIGSNSGLMRVRKKDLESFTPGGGDIISCRGYDMRDGLPATECTHGSEPAACRTRAGLIWFPTIGGMVSLNPADIHVNTNPTPVVIESILLDQQPQNTNGLRTLPPAAVTVPPGHGNLEIHYTSLDLAGASRAYFRYRLQPEGGGTNRWTMAGRDRSVRYPNLPHGNYRFEVQARNADGFWNDTGAMLAVIVLPPFWEQWWFRGLVAAGLIGLIAAVVHFVSTQRLQQQVAGLRQQQALEKERARIARDIHDQVGASLTQLSLLGEMVMADKDKPVEVETHAGQISQAARETAHELDEIVWTVNPSNDTLEGLVNYICKHAQEYLAVAGLRYRLDVPAQLPAVSISPETRHNVFLAAKEAVTNIVKHARATEAWLRLRLNDQQIIVEIEDNGRGPAGRKEKAAQSRNGLRNMHKRLEDVGGEFFIGSGSQGGTLVRLTVPLRKG